jgi:hypothetical protein
MVMKADTSIFRAWVCIAAVLIATGAVLHGTVAQAADQLSGIWTGSYHCAQGDTAVTVSLSVEDGGAARGTFTFGNLPGRSNVKPGKYRIEGRYDELGASLQMRPAGWIVQPPGYTQVGFTVTYDRAAQRLTGRIQFSSCSTITLNKTSN